MKYIIFFLGLITSGLANAQHSNWFCDTDDDGATTRWYDTEVGKQKALLIHPKRTTSSDLIVFIHGDSPFGDPVYQYNIAKRISQLTNATTVAILRPGYKDGCGDKSEGIKGLTMGDNYTEEVTTTIATVIASIKEEENTSRTIIIGHSGGAALTALLAESKPDLADQSILVACPCNLGAWRKSMERLTANPNWSNITAGLSPIDSISNLDLSKKIHLYVGKDDVVTPPFLTTEFYEATSKMGANVTMKIIPEADHESILKQAHLTMFFEELGLIRN